MNQKENENTDQSHHENHESTHLIGGVRTCFDPQPRRLGQWPNKLKTINLLESGPVIERSMS